MVTFGHCLLVVSTKSKHGGGGGAGGAWSRDGARPGTSLPGGPVVKNPPAEEAGDRVFSIDP